MTPPALGKGAAKGHTAGQVWSGLPSPEQAFLGVTGLSPCGGAEQTPVNNCQSHPSAERRGDAQGTASRADRISAAAAGK